MMMMEEKKAAGSVRGGGGLAAAPGWLSRQSAVGRYHPATNTQQEA